MTPSWLEGIDGPEARTLIESDAQVVRVVAGPGAGKTTCLKRRAQRIIEGRGLGPDQIFVGTFTRAIANELREELGSAIKVQTLHSLAYELLRDNPTACAGFQLRFLLEYEENSMLYDVASSVPHLSDQRERRQALRRLQSARAERQAIPDAQFAGAVHNWLREHGGMLIGEVVHLAVQGLESHDIPPGQYDQVIVDEYQDLTASEQELVERIWSGKGSLVVLGDNDQSIYGFRFNHPDGIEEFRTRWHEHDLCDIGIDENRRCGETIVHLANQMMAEAGSAKQPMVSLSGREGRVALVQWDHLDTEIEGLASYIQSKSEESFLIVVPRRFIGYRLKDAIGGDARTSFREEVLESQVAQERFSAASVLANPSDRVAVRAWLGLHGSKPEQAPKRNAEAYARIPAGLDGEALARRLASGEVEVRGSGSRFVKARAAQLVAWLDGDFPDTLVDQVEELFDPSLAMLHETEREKQRWLASDLSALKQAAVALTEEDDATLASVISTLRYRIATRAPLHPEDEDPRVRIMTLHAAKGLEADNIIVAGVADQLVPGRTADPEKRKEQGRLLYVAVTRAKANLVVSWSRAVRYADAKRNGARIEEVRTIGGEQVVLMGRSTLLPQSLTGVQAGSDWLEEEG